MIPNVKINIVILLIKVICQSSNCSSQKAKLDEQTCAGTVSRCVAP